MFAFQTLTLDSSSHKWSSLVALAEHLAEAFKAVETVLEADKLLLVMVVDSVVDLVVDLEDLEAVSANRLESLF